MGASRTRSQPGSAPARRITPDGRIRLDWLPTHPAGAPAPLVTLDREPQPEVTPANATAWARALVGEHPATRTVH